AAVVLASANPIAVRHGAMANEQCPSSSAVARHFHAVSPHLVGNGDVPVNLLRLRDDTGGLLEGIEMALRTTLLACLLGVTLLNLAGAPAHPTDCKEPEPGTDAVPIISPPLANVVTGTGRLQFYSAPSERCPMPGVFVIPKDSLISYAQTD